MKSAMKTTIKTTQLACEGTCSVLGGGAGHLSASMVAAGTGVGLQATSWLSGVAATGLSAVGVNTSTLLSLGLLAINPFFLAGFVLVGGVAGYVACKGAQAVHSLDADVERRVALMGYEDGVQD